MSTVRTPVAVPAINTRLRYVGSRPEKDAPRWMSDPLTFRRDLGFGVWEVFSTSGSKAIDAIDLALDLGTAAPVVDRPQVGDTVYARWAVGPATQGSGWLDPSRAPQLDAFTVAAVSDYGLRLGLPNGGQLSIYDGQYLTQRPPVVDPEIAAELREREAIAADARNERDGYQG